MASAADQLSLYGQWHKVEPDCLQHADDYTSLHFPARSGLTLMGTELCQELKLCPSSSAQG
jgi:hypothetical protein